MTTDDAAQGEAEDGHAYRAKLMVEGGRIETTIAIMATSDNEALQQVVGLARSYHVELWDAGRLVLRVPHEPSGRGPAREWDTP